MKKKPNKIDDMKNILNEIQRVGAFVEHVDDKVSVMAEMLTDMKKTQDKHGEILEQHSEILDQHAAILKTIVLKLDNKDDRTELRKSALIHSS